MNPEMVFYLIKLQVFLLILIPNISSAAPNDWFVPIAVEDRSAWKSLQLTLIGTFAHPRKARPGIPRHLHSGIDIMRPNNNYADEPIFPSSPGVVISKRDDGPFAQIIIEHKQDSNRNVWTVYEHISGISVSVGDKVGPFEPIARFMNKEELSQYGRQFDHVHFEVLKQKPKPIPPYSKTPARFFTAYGLECYTETDIRRYYYDPLEFMGDYILGYE